MENLPAYISIVFILTTLLSAGLFYKAAHYSKAVLFILMCWLMIQALVAWAGFYTNTAGLPPRFILLIVPPLLAIGILFFTAKGHLFIDHLNIRTLTILHMVRIPVELVLYWLFLQKAVPGLMTFEGRNFDILSGLTAPFIWYFGFIKKVLSGKIILAWNIVCLGLLLNIVLNALLSAPFTFQQFGFEQPDIAITYFPFTWLPSVIVPFVLFSHLAVIRKLWKADLRMPAPKDIAVA